MFTKVVLFCSAHGYEERWVTFVLCELSFIDESVIPTMLMFCDKLEVCLGIQKRNFFNWQVWVNLLGETMPRLGVDT